MKTETQLQGCEGLEAPGFPDELVAIHEGMTLAELRQLPIESVIAALAPSPARVIVRRYGAFGPFFFRPMEFPKAGSKVDGHAHKWDHVTWLTSGKLLMKARQLNGVTNTGFGPTIRRTFKAPCAICIKADWMHEFTALTDNVRADCIFALRDAVTGELTDEYQGNLEDYA